MPIFLKKTTQFYIWGNVVIPNTFSDVTNHLILRKTLRSKARRHFHPFFYVSGNWGSKRYGVVPRWPDHRPGFGSPLSPLVLMRVCNLLNINISNFRFLHLERWIGLIFRCLLLRRQPNQHQRSIRWLPKSEAYKHAMISNVIEFLIKAGTDVFTTYSSIRR